MIFQEFRGLLLKPAQALIFPLSPVPDKRVVSGKLLFSRIIQENLSIFKYFIKPVQTLNTATCILPLVPGVCLVIFHFQALCQKHEILLYLL